MEAMDEAIAEIDLGGAEIDDECGGDARLKREGGAGAHVSAPTEAPTSEQ